MDNRAQEIEEKAEEVLRSVYPEKLELPISLEKILEYFKLNLKSGNFQKSELAGAIDRENNTIYVARDDPYTRKAFTVAHELGHFILHKNKSRELFYRRQVISLDQEDSSDEKEANFFAASLLMPLDLIKKYFSLTKNLKELSTVFGVSPSAVHWRLKNLGLV